MTRAAIDNAEESSSPLINNSAMQMQLTMQDINILVVTDVHSWVGGHPHNDTLDVDYGHVLSFYERLQEISLRQEKDLFFVMNGDFVDGTGLTTYPPEHLTPILEKMPWDAVNIGNHELYRNSTIEYIMKEGGFVDHWQGRYLTTNVLLVETGEPIGDRYTFLKGTFSNRTILTFGFIYDMPDSCSMTMVEYVEEVVNTDWFREIIDVEKKTSKSHEKTPRVDLIVGSLKRTTEHSQVYIIQNESFVSHVVCV